MNFYLCCCCLWRGLGERRDSRKSTPSARPWPCGFSPDAFSKVWLWARAKLGPSSVLGIVALNRNHDIGGVSVFRFLTCFVLVFFVFLYLDLVKKLHKALPGSLPTLRKVSAGRPAAHLAGFSDIGSVPRHVSTVAQHAVETSKKNLGCAILERSEYLFLLPWLRSIFVQVEKEHRSVGQWTDRSCRTTTQTLYLMRSPERKGVILFPGSLLKALNFQKQNNPLGSTHIITCHGYQLFKKKL